MAHQADLQAWANSSPRASPDGAPPRPHLQIPRLMLRMRGVVFLALGVGQLDQILRGLAVLLEKRHKLRFAEQLDELAVELGDDLRRRAFGRRKAPPAASGKIPPPDFLV